jgi:hypothetical protein
MARIAEESRGNSAMSIAEPELRPGEHLVWADRPGLMAVARQDLPSSLMGVPFTAFAVFWLVQVMKIDKSANMAIGYFFPLWGLMFVGIGLFLLLRPVISAGKARSTVYAITDQRLFIASGAWTRRVDSYGPEQIASLERTERANGFGDIVFRKEAQQMSLRVGYRTSLKSIGFFGVPEVRKVEAAIQALAATAKQG